MPSGEEIYAANRFLPGPQEYLDRICSSDFDRADFMLDAGLKDIRLILDAAAQVRVPLPCASLVKDKCIVAQARAQSVRLVGFHGNLFP